MENEELESKKTFMDKSKEINEKFLNNMKKSIAAGLITISATFTPINANDIQQQIPTKIEMSQQEKGFENGKLLSMSLETEYLQDQLKFLIVNDKNNFISQDDKNLYAKYIVNPNDKKLEQQVIKKFTNYVENFNRNNPNDEFSTSFIRNPIGTSDGYDKMFLSHRSIFDTTISFDKFKGDWTKNKTIEEQYNILKNSQIISFDSECVYKDLKEMLKKEKDFVLSNNNDSYEEYNKLLKETNELLFKSIQRDVQNNLNLKTNAYSKYNYDFIKEDISKLNFVKSSLIEPKESSLMKEYNALNNIINSVSKNKEDVSSNLKVLNNEITNLKSLRNDYSLFESYKEINKLNETNDPKLKEKYEQFIVNLNNHYSNNDIFKGKYDYNSLLEKINNLEQKDNVVVNNENLNILSLNDR